MFETKTQPERPNYKKVVKVSPGETIQFGTEVGFTSAVIGRDPTDRPADFSIPENCLGVMLDGTSSENTSRLQLKIERNKERSYIIRNLSETIPSVLEKGGRRFDLDPLQSHIVGSKIEDFKDLTIHSLAFTLEADNPYSTPDGGWGLGLKRKR